MVMAAGIVSGVSVAKMAGLHWQHMAGRQHGLVREAAGARACRPAHGWPTVSVTFMAERDVFN
jgi:hypothetical protein